MKKWLFPKRFAALRGFCITYLVFAFVIRLTLYFLSIKYIDFSVVNLFKVFSIGLLYDIGALSYIMAMSAVYLLLLPSEWYGSKFDRIATRVFYALFIFVMSFSFLAEITFWDEYQRRFNFIAIDYLLYTYTVIENIHETFPLQYLIVILLVISYVSIKIAAKRKAFKYSFESQEGLLRRVVPAVIIFAILGVYHFKVENKQAEVFDNMNENELAKSGLYSFFAAFNNLELSYTEFYKTLPEEELNSIIQKEVALQNDSLLNDSSIYRCIKNEGEEQYPNVIFVGLESMNAEFMKRFGYGEVITPALDSIFKNSIAFTNVYATGTRTIRGLEAIALSIPPTPGRSIVKRPNNENLFTIGEVFKQKGYSRTFITGGDGFFDNMAYFFSHSGFDIVDRTADPDDLEPLPTKRTQIRDDQVTFENAWGACDQDIYNVILDMADQDSKTDQPFFYLFMTNSNHPPYTYPDGVVDVPSGDGRTGSVKYADAAFGEFFRKAAKKDWFKNTVFVIMSDHCAYSAGRTYFNLSRHHIPALIYNLPSQKAVELDGLASQIDVFPTLFGYLNWSYKTNLFGKDLNKTPIEDQRAFIANHRSLGYLKNDQFLVLETQSASSIYTYDKKNNKLSECKCTDDCIEKEAIAYYQTAYEMFKNGQLSIEND